MKSIPAYVTKRIALSLVIGLVIGGGISELSFLFLKETARPPETITLLIPEGTAEKVANGEQPPGIPQDLIFVVGDVLLVKNEDNTSHSLGPLWIPAHASAQMNLGEEQNIAVECSFQPGNYIGLDVRQPLTWGTRLYGMSFAGVPLAILILLYSFVVSPQKKENAVA